MGSMSASDAAPLPRLGEVYFDVRGESRSMRLSWYADTGVAVFSIWQGGTCTGTFRLPIADLPRMIETLQRGPHGDAREADGPHDPRATELHGMPGQEGRAGHDAGHASGQYGPGDYGPGDHGRTERYDIPGRDLGPEPDTGYSDPGFPAAAASNPEGYGRTGAHARYEETRALYPDEGLPGAGGYREERGGAYADEPATGVYRGGSEDTGGRRPDRRGGHEDDPLSPTYRADAHDDPLSSGYGDDPLSAGYREAPHDDPLRGGYGDDSLPGGYRGEPHGGPYRADSLPGGYRADMGGGHHDDPLPAGYASEPRGGGHRAGRHGGDYADDPLTGAYPGERYAGGYPDDPSDSYPGDLRGGYADEPRTARYRADSPSGDYPTGPSDPPIDDPDYLPRPAMPVIRPPGHTWRPFPMAREGPAKGAVGGAGAAAGRKATFLPIPSLMAARPLSPRCAAGEDNPAVLTSSCRLKGVRPGPQGCRTGRSGPRAGPVTANGVQSITQSVPSTAPAVLSAG